MASTDGLPTELPKDERGRDPRDHEEDHERHLRNFALWVIIVLLLLALFTLFQNPGQRTSSQDISFRNF